LPNERELTGPACGEAMSGDEKDGTRERKSGNAGVVRVERRVRQSHELGTAKRPDEPKRQVVKDEKVGQNQS
jgi:hypothetical protein